MLTFLFENALTVCLCQNVPFFIKSPFAMWLFIYIQEHGLKFVYKQSIALLKEKGSMTTTIETTNS